MFKVGLGEVFVALVLDELVVLPPARIRRAAPLFPWLHDQAKARYLHECFVDAWIPLVDYGAVLIHVRGRSAWINSLAQDLCDNIDFGCRC